jgi:hypothetical protein
MQHRNNAPALPAFVKANGRNACESYMDFFERQSLGAASNYRSAARRFFGWAEGQGVTLAAVGKEHVDQFHRYLWEEAGPNMAANSFSVISRLFRHMHEQGGLSFNPAEGVRVKSHVPVKKIKRWLCEHLEVGEDDEVVQAALVMLAPVCIATFSLKAIRAYTQIPFSTVEKIAARLYDQGIWVKENTIRCEWLEENCENPDFAIMMDAFVGAGDFDRNEDMAYCLPQERCERLKAEQEKAAGPVEVTRTVREERLEVVTVREASETVIQRPGE